MQCRFEDARGVPGRDGATAPRTAAESFKIAQDWSAQASVVRALSSREAMRNMLICVILSVLLSTNFVVRSGDPPGRPKRALAFTGSAEDTSQGPALPVPARQ